LQKMTVDLMNVITHASVDVTEEVAGKAVVVAGIVADVRQITTKKGETMAFVRLEDLQGSIDVTVFPRLYADEKASFALEKIIIVAGKADVRNGRVSVVADTVRDYVEGMKVIEDTSSVAYRFRNGAAGMPTHPQVKERPNAQSYAALARAYAPPPTIAGGDEDEETYVGDDNPFAADEPVWLGAGETEREGEGTKERQGDKQAGKQVDKELKETAAPQKAAPVLARQSKEAVPPKPAPTQTTSAAKPDANATSKPEVPATPQVIQTRETSDPTPTPAASPPNPKSAVRNPRSIKLAFRRSTSLDTDRKRLAEIVDVLSKYPGEDRFEITVEANGSARWQLDFPNNRTRVCSELQAELTRRLGPGGWKVEG
jgi:OB-fold nucleic acid binding domain